MGCAHVDAAALDELAHLVGLAVGAERDEGGYGNTRYKLVDDDVYLSDANYGGSTRALLLDASRRELLIGEGGWLKVVDNISLWQSDVATENPCTPTISVPLRNETFHGTWVQI